MNANYIELSYGDFFADGIWCVTRQSNQLIRIDVVTGVAEIAMSIPKDDLQIGEGLVISLGEYKFLIVAQKTKKIICVDINKRTIELIDGLQLNVNGLTMFASSLKVQNNIYLFPGETDKILRIDNKLKDIVYQNKYIGMELSEQRFKYGDRITQYENKIYATEATKDILIELDLDLNNCVVHSIENDCMVSGFSNLTIYDNQIYMIDYDGVLKIYELHSKKIVKSIKFNSIYSSIKRHKRGFVLIPLQTDKFAFYELDKNTVKEIDYPKTYISEQFMKTGRRAKYVNIIETDVYYYVMSKGGSTIIKISKNDMIIEWITVEYGKSLLNYLFSQAGDIMMEKCSIVDGMSFDTKLYKQYVQGSKKINCFDNNESIGKKIHKTLMK